MPLKRDVERQVREEIQQQALAPWAYLSEVLTNLPQDPGDLDRWLPDRWAARG